MGLSNEQLSAFAALIGQAVNQHLSNAKPTSQTHTVIREVKGKRKKVETTLPMLLAELNDRLEYMAAAIEENTDALDESLATERKKKRKRNSVIKA